MKYPIKPPSNQPLSSILPKEPLLLMGAGPVPIPDAVAQANGVVINHLGATMNHVISQLKEMASYAFQTSSKHIIGISGPASAAMEMAVTNLLWRGRSVLVLKVGTFSGRFAEMAESVGADVTLLESKDFNPHFPADIAAAFKKKKYDVVTIVQGETSCGVFNKHLSEIAKIAKDNGALVIADAVCTLTTMPLFMDEWQLDAVVTGGQKGLSSIPGVSLIAFSNEAWDLIEKRKIPIPHWCLDAKRAARFWQHQEYHYTAPVPGILAIHEALKLICDETLEKRFHRHIRSSLALQAGLEGMGLELFIPYDHRLASVVAIKTPNGIDSEVVRNSMIKNHHVEISGAFGLDILRIGQMGEQCRSHNLFRTLYALGRSLKDAGFKADVSSGMAASEKKLEEYFKA